MQSAPLIGPKLTVVVVCFGPVGRAGNVTAIEGFSMTEISFTNEISVTKHDITGKVGEI